MKLIAKLKITGQLEAVSGLRIGGNKSSLEIGGVDLNIIKSGRGVPYIPGSSLKGKLRTLLARVRGSDSVNSDPPEIKSLFGSSGPETTRLFVRDSALDEKAFEEKFGSGKERLLDFPFSEVKMENSIERTSGTARDPRQIERVPAGTIFNFELAIDVYDEKEIEPNLKLLSEALQLLNMDYLGGHGSRGSGQVNAIVSGIDGKKFDPAQGIQSMDCEGYKKYFSELMTPDK